MKLERTFQGLEATVKPTGVGRFGGAAFLLVWLTFWTVGEILVLGILLLGGWSLLTGQPPLAGRAPLETAPSLGVGLFLLGWLTLWTFGGVMAWRELLRSLFGRDRLIARADALEIEHGYGLFRTRQTLPRDQLRRFYCATSGKNLSAETVNGIVGLARLGTKAEFEELAAALNKEFALPSEAARTGLLPGAWLELRSPEGETILIKNPATRRKQALAAWIAFVVLASVAAYTLNATRERLSLGGLAAIITALAGFAGWGAYRLSYRRDEWIVGKGRLVLQARIRERITRRFEAGALQLREDRDSDGDPWFRLVAVPARLSTGLPVREVRKQQRTLGSRAGDPTELRNLGRWLEQRCRLPFTDHTTAEAKEQDYEKLKERLANSGRWGQAALRLIERLSPKQD